MKSHEEGEHGYHPSTGIWDIIYNYGGWTGTHGVAHVMFAESAGLRVFWSAVTLLAFLGMTLELLILLRIYFTFPTVVDVSILASTLTFPTTTICNANAWKRGQVNGTSLQGLVSAYETTGASAEYGFGAVGEERVYRAQNWMWLMSEELVEEDRSGLVQLGYAWEELFVACEYDETPCSERW